MAKKRKTKNTPKANASGHLEIYTDGGCAVNPGGVGGYGAVILDKDTGEYTEYSGGFRSSTNNRMEIMAAIVALEHIPDGESATLFSDSEYLVCTMRGEYAQRKNLDLWNRINRAIAGKNIEFCWVRGHNGDVYNERCDTLATSAMEGAVELQIDTGYESGNRTPRGFGAGNGTNRSKAPPEIPDSIPKKYAGDARQIKPSCSAGIARLNKADNPKFKEFMALKTGGMDGWSKLKLPEAEALFGAEIIDHARSVFPIEKEMLTCLRWYGRGLEYPKAVRKVMVDAEVTQNCIGRR